MEMRLTTGGIRSGEGLYDFLINKNTGVDSLVAIEVRNWWKQNFSADLGVGVGVNEWWQCCSPRRVGCETLLKGQDGCNKEQLGMTSQLLFY